MKLYLNKTSPYARLVMVVAHEKGLEKKIEPVWTDPWESPPELLAANPFSKVPALTTDSGVTIVDSTCICDYLDEAGGGRRLMPREGEERLRVLRKYGLGRNLIDAAFAVTIERRFHDATVLPLAGRWLASVGRAIDSFEHDSALLAPGDSPDLGDLALAVGLSYTDFRLSSDVQWKATSPALARWFVRLAARPSMQATAPK